MLRALSLGPRPSLQQNGLMNSFKREFSSIPTVSFSQNCFESLQHLMNVFLHQTGLLTRDFIGYSLYDRNVGYFNKPGIIHSPPELPFKEFLGGGAYKKHVAMLYQETPGAWLTPVELFKVSGWTNKLSDNSNRQL
jgi:hypothetical protein